MITDSPPRASTRLTQYRKSDEVRTLELPTHAELGPLAGAIEAALADASRPDVERACDAFAVEIARAQGLAPPPVQVLGVRPHKTDDGRCVYEKFGDYDLETHHIRVWMKTAMQHKVTAFGTLLHTLCHEICHHIDVVGMRIGDTPHTRGFYERASVMYHQARGTPRKKLIWVSMNDGRYRIGWQKTMKG